MAGARNDSVPGPGPRSPDTRPRGTPYAHEPQGFAKLTEIPFQEPVEDGWENPHGRLFAIVQDPSAPQSPPWVAQITYPARFEGGRSPNHMTRMLEPGHNSVYCSFWFKLSQGWVGHQSGVNKVIYLWVGDPPQPQVYFSAQGRAFLPLIPQIHLQGLDVDRSTRDGARNLNPNMNPGLRLMRGRWYHIEILLSSNTGNNPDGRVTWWVDGALAGNYSNIGFTRERAGKAWRTVQFAPVWGGRGDAIRLDQYMWMDHLYVSGN